MLEKVREQDEDEGRGALEGERNVIKSFPYAILPVLSHVNIMVAYDPNEPYYKG